MAKRRLLSHHVKITCLATLTAGLIAAVGKRIIDYSSEPTGEKDCSPSLPGHGPDVAVLAIPETVRSIQQPPWSQQGGFINDVSCLNKTPVFGIVRVKTVEDVRRAIQFAKERGVGISIAGVRHSMGGQAFFANAVVLDMTGFNRLLVDREKKLLTVQSGATWHDVQSFLHPHGLAVKAMQSTDVLTVGGSIAVNAHGMDHRVGALARTLQSFTIMLADGTLHTITPQENPELFNAVIGGYGLFGVVLDATIKVTDNVMYSRERRFIDYRNFPKVFEQEIIPNERYGLLYGHLSIAPGSFLKEMILYTYKEVNELEEIIPLLTDTRHVKLRRFVLNVSKTSPLAKQVRWWVEKYVEPHLESSVVTRHQALREGEASLVSRNKAMHDSVKYTKNNLRGETVILQEYFIPRGHFVSFIDGMRAVLQARRANLLNASVRVVHRESVLLSYAKDEMFSIVLYLNQKATESGNREMTELTQALVELAIKSSGTFFLPYQLYYTQEQLQRAYPEATSFFKLKRKYDPKSLFSNKFYEKYANRIDL